MKKFLTNSLFINGGALVVAGILVTIAIVNTPHVKASVCNADCPPGVFDYQCPYGSSCKKRPGGKGKPCKETTIGGGSSGGCFSDCTCQAGFADSQSGSGSSLTDMVKLLQSVSDMMKAMNGGSGSGSGSGSGYNTAGTTCSDGSYSSTGVCPTTVSSTLTNTGTNTTGTSMSDLLNAIGGNASGTIPTAPTNTNSNTPPGSTTQNNNQSNVSVTGTTTTPPVAPAAQITGVKGDMIIKNTGVTMFASNVDTKMNKLIAGFYGVNIASGQTPTALVTQLCAARPWATNFLTSVAPPLFFDALCSYKGYKVGTPKVTVVNKPYTPPAPKPAATTTPATTTPPVATGPVVPPKVQIWATPATVPLDTRTSIFWNTQGVTDCMETSPDGSFTQNSLSGGASTVPLTADTTFTISCQAPDGTPVTGYTTVRIEL